MQLPYSFYQTKNRQVHKMYCWYWLVGFGIGGNKCCFLAIPYRSERKT